MSTNQCSTDYTLVKQFQQPAKRLAMPRYRRWELAKDEIARFPQGLELGVYRKRRRIVWDKWGL